MSAINDGIVVTHLGLDSTNGEYELIIDWHDWLTCFTKICGFEQFHPSNSSSSGFAKTIELRILLYIHILTEIITNV